MVNDAYRPLAEMGLNFTGTFQDEDITRERMRDAKVFVLKRDDRLIGSISLRQDPIPELGFDCVYINQLAVHPELKGTGLGSYLLDFSEYFTVQSNLERLRLDTAIPAKHLVEMYLRRGFRVVNEVQWDGKAYRSYIMEKNL